MEKPKKIMLVDDLNDDSSLQKHKENIEEKIKSVQIILCRGIDDCLSLLRQESFDLIVFLSSFLNPGALKVIAEETYAGYDPQYSASLCLIQMINGILPNPGEPFKATRNTPIIVLFNTPSEYILKEFQRIIEPLNFFLYGYYRPIERIPNRIKDILST